MVNSPTRQDRYRGALLGLAAGDALGTTLEFTRPGTFAPLTDMVGGGPFNLPPGAWTDDTSMALCLAESLLERRGFDPADQMDRYVRWFKEGHLSSTGSCFDIGNATRTALGRFLATGDPYSGSADPHSAGNGSLMRLAPIALAYARRPEQALEYAALSSRTTHKAETAVDACRLYAALMVGALNGVDKTRLLAADFWSYGPLHPEVAAVAAGSFRRREPPEIRGSGYVVQSLEAALWAFHKTESFAAGALGAVNLGDDADTTGAVYGQLAGAYYGVQDVPEDWLEKLVMKETIVEFADGLLELADLGPST